MFGVPVWLPVGAGITDSQGQRCEDDEEPHSLLTSDQRAAARFRAQGTLTSPSGPFVDASESGMWRLLPGLSRSTS